MVGIAEISAGLGSIKAAFDIAKGLNSASTQAGLNEVKVDLTQHILDAQAALAAAYEAQSAAANRIAELEQEIVRLKDWEGEKQRYELNAIAPRAFAYVIKAGVEAPEAPHWLCANCFDDSHKSILQWTGDVTTPPGGLGMIARWRCGKCANSVAVGRNQTPSGDD